MTTPGAGSRTRQRTRTTGFVSTADGTRIFLKDWAPKDGNSGPPVVFSHGWPLCPDAWNGQMPPMLHNGFRVVAHDRRGHGRSDRPGTGNDMDTYADDLAAVMDALDLRDAVMAGHSTGGGEVARTTGPPRHRPRRPGPAQRRPAGVRAGLKQAEG